MTTDKTGGDAWDWTTAEGRAALDLGILRVLAAEPDTERDAAHFWCSRKMMADRLKIDDSENALRAVSRGLGRLVRAGLAVHHGKLKATVYRASAAGRREAAKEGGGK